jgi:hypothetical protein
MRAGVVTVGGSKVRSEKSKCKASEVALPINAELPDLGLSKRT